MLNLTGCTHRTPNPATARLWITGRTGCDSCIPSQERGATTCRAGRGRRRLDAAGAGGVHGRERRRVRNPYAVLAARLSAAELPAPRRLRPSRPPWCGQCDEVTRMLGFDGDAPSPCPRCKPAACAKQPNSRQQTLVAYAGADRTTLSSSVSRPGRRSPPRASARPRSVRSPAMTYVSLRRFEVDSNGK
jgi:hypothetical protein